MEHARTQSTRALSLALCAVGVLMIVATVARGGGPLAVGVVAGVLFVLLGGARYRLASARGEATERG